MKYKKCTNPEVYGFGILIPKRYYSYVKKYKTKIEPYLDWVVKKDDSPKNNSMRMHIAIKYLGYHKNYTDKEIRKLIPELKQISKKYLPLTITIKGLKLGTKYDNLGILLNYKANKNLKRFNKEIIEKLGNKIDIFENQDGDNFDDHITIGAGPKEKKKIKELRKIIKESKKDKQIKIKCSKVYIFLKDKGPIEINI